ncbi:MAG: uroporphyrinogen decarboxylase/cobalamine-independent methonine synthase family protein [Armatimonadota bacterium]
MDQLLSWFGEERYYADLERVRRFWAGEGRVIVSMTSDHAAYRQSLDDELILSKSVDNLHDQARLPGVNLPSFFPDFGTISTAKYWGGNWRFDSTGSNIFIDPVAATLDEALELTPRPVDDPELDAARSLRLYRQLCERLETEHLWFRSPDFQGTLNTAGLIVEQQELLIGMHSEPEKVHAFLEKVCTFLIDYGQYLIRETNGKVCGNIWPYTFLPAELGMSFTEDLMPLLSPELYLEFGIPYVKRLNEAFGGVQIHCCGDWGRHAENLHAAGIRLHAAEFHDPFTDISELAPLADTVFATYLIPDRQARYIDQFDYFRRLLAETPYRYWFPLTAESEEGRQFIEECDHAFI